MEMTKFNEKYENYLKKIEKEMEEKYNFRTNAKYYLDKKGYWLFWGENGTEEKFYNFLTELMDKKVLHGVNSSYQYDDNFDTSEFYLWINLLPMAESKLNELKEKYPQFNFEIDKDYTFGTTYNKVYKNYWCKDEMEELLELQKTDPLQLTRANEVGIKEYLEEKELMEEEIKNGTINIFASINLYTEDDNGSEHWDTLIKLLKENF